MARLFAAEIDDQASSVASLDELRSLLLQENDQRLDALEQSLAATNSHISSPERLVQDSSRVLAEAVELRQQHDDKLAEALQPVLVDGFHRSIRDDPNVLAESLYPVLGPAVRKMVASLFTPEKANPSQPYSIEQIYVIHRETSLLINQTLVEASAAQDGDMVSGMLDAIRSFVRDAFEAHEFDGLDTLTVGDLTVWVEWGPEAIMAIVVRGMAPARLRPYFSRELENIHVSHGHALREFGGDNAEFDFLTSQLTLMVKQVTAPQVVERVKRWLSPAFAAAILLLFVIGAGYWIHVGNQWRSLVSQLNASPGIVVVSAHRGWRDYQIVGIRDPLAEDPRQLIASAAVGIDSERIDSQWSPYQSMDDSIVEARARLLLQPPLEVDLTVTDGDLVLTGSPSNEWIVQTYQAMSVVKSLLGKELIFNFKPE